jgi:hypothetical protein
VSTSDSQTDDDDKPVPVLLQLELAPGRELRGSICRHGDASSVPFHGWIDFMAAVSLLRDASAAAESW